MSIHINKSGLLDTLQDEGRYGYQHLGVNPGGAMDRIAMHIANALVGNQPNETVLEMHFPAAEILFKETLLIALAGADFSATINGKELPILHPVLISKGSILAFGKRKNGARVYLSVQGGFTADTWLNSTSTNTKVNAGGFQGRALQKNDQLLLNNPGAFSFVFTDHAFEVLPWKAKTAELYTTNSIRFIAGAEFGNLHNQSIVVMKTQVYTISRDSDRMGYRLQAEPLPTLSHQEMISTAVTRGTIQLLPNGQLIILMADHQTTGGYPRIGHVITVDLPILAQMQAGETFQLQEINPEQSEDLFFEQEMNLQQLQNACNFRLQEYLNA